MTDENGFNNATPVAPIPDAGVREGLVRQPSDAEIDAIWKGWNGADIENAKRSLNYMDRYAARDLARAMIAATPVAPIPDAGVREALAKAKQAVLNLLRREP